MFRFVKRGTNIAPPSGNDSTDRQDTQTPFRREPQQQRSQDRVEQILAAAAEVFWKKGYDVATTHDIAGQANTAVGTLYRFFPNKLAIFHELEKRHRQRVEEINASLMTPDVSKLPIAVIVRRIVEDFGEYFKAYGPRVVYTQYFLTPNIFLYFDDSFDQQNIRAFAQLLRLRNEALSVEKSERIALAFLRTYQALLLSALRGSEDHRQLMYEEIQVMLTNYLEPYVGEQVVLRQQEIARRVEEMARSHSLNPRQKAALQQVIAQGELTIQTMEMMFPVRSRRTLQRDLKALVTLNLLKSKGSTNQTIYRAGGKLSCDI